MNRGLIAGDGRWVQLREAQAAGENSLHLRAERRSKEIGSIHMLSGHVTSTSPLATITLDVDTAYRGMGIGQLLVNTALEWAGE